MGNCITAMKKKVRLNVPSNTDKKKVLIPPLEEGYNRSFLLSVLGSTYKTALEALGSSACDSVGKAMWTERCGVETEQEGEVVLMGMQTWDSSRA